MVQVPYGIAANPENAVSYLVSRGIAKGYGDGNYHAERHITHVEFIALVMRASQGNSYGPCSGVYATDLPRGAWYTPYVCEARSLGILQHAVGFDPSAHIALGDASKILVYAYGIPVVSFGENFDAYVRVLLERRVIPEGMVGVDKVLTRGDVAEMLFRLITGDMGRPSQTADGLGVASMHTSPFDVHQQFQQEGDIRVTVDLGVGRIEPRDDFRALIRLENEGKEGHRVNVYAVLDRDFDILSLSRDGERLSEGGARWSDVWVRGGDVVTLSVLLRVTRHANRNDTLGMRAITEDEQGRRSSASDEVRVSRGDDDDFDDDEGDIRVEIEAEEDDPRQGETVTFTIRVENDNNEDVRADVRVHFDEDFDFVSASGDGEHHSGDSVRFEDLEIDEGERMHLRLQLRVDHDADRGDSLEVRVEVEDDEGNDDEDEETVEVEGSGDDEDDDNDELELSVSVNDSRPRPGSILTYSIRVRNETDEDQEVDVQASFDDDLEFVDAYDGGDQEGSRRVEWDELFVREGEEKSLTLHLQVEDGADDGDELELKVTAEDDDGNRDRETRSVRVREE